MVPCLHTLEPLPLSGESPSCHIDALKRSLLGGLKSLLSDELIRNLRASAAVDELHAIRATIDAPMIDDDLERWLLRASVILFLIYDISSSERVALRDDACVWAVDHGNFKNVMLSRASICKVYAR